MQEHIICGHVHFEVGQLVFRKNFAQSKATEHFFSKLANQYEKGKVVAKHGSSYYELEDMSGKNIGRH